MAENECPNFAGLFTTKVIKSHVKLHVKSDAQKVNFLVASCSSQHNTLDGSIRATDEGIA